MEEVDSIILHSLRQMGIDIPPAIESLLEFPANLVVVAVAKCLQTILPGLDVPKSLSSGMSQKYQIASRLAVICKDLGYKGDMGYQTFLYPDENDLRRVLMFLIERLPKEFDKNEDSQPEDSLSILLLNVREKIEHDLNEAWIPPYCRKGSSPANNIGAYLYKGCCYAASGVVNNVTSGSSIKPDSIKTIHGSRNNIVEYNMNLTDKNNLDDLDVKNIIERFTTFQAQKSPEIQNLSNEMHSISTSVSDDPHSAEMPFQDNEIQSVNKNNNLLKSDEPNNKKHNTMLQLKQELFILKENIYLIESEIHHLKQSFSKLATLKTQRYKDIEGLVSSINKYKTCIDEIPTSEDDLKHINRTIEEIEERMSNLVKEWDKHRVPVEIEIQAIEQNRSENQSPISKKMKEIELIKTKYDEIQEEMFKKQNLHSELIKEYTNLSKNIKSRSGYTRKIMEIIGNISKQKTEIEKILSDMRIIQKEINNLNGQLDRSFTLADEMIFKDVKKDDNSKRAYKLLATLHTVCGDITTMVNDTGTCLRDIRDLEEHIEAELSKNIKETLDKITTDLKQTQIEEQTLKKKLKERFEEHSSQNEN